MVQKYLKEFKLYEKISFFDKWTIPKKVNPNGIIGVSKSESRVNYFLKKVFLILLRRSFPS